MGQFLAVQVLYTLYQDDALSRG